MDMPVPPFLSEIKGKAAFPLVVASPHAGTFYPERLFALTELPFEKLQKFEDAAVDKLFSFVPSFGIPFVKATYARVWVDLNRHPLDLDPSMYVDSLPAKALTDSPRVLSGFGVIPKLLDPETPVYKHKLRFAVEKERLTDVHVPYHAEIRRLIEKNLARFGRNLLLDVHSMPDLPPDRRIKGKTPDIVLGDGNGKTCPSALVAAMADFLRERGYFVTVDLPYSGAYTTLYYGVPEKKSYALQIEVARHLYWDSDFYRKTTGFDTVWRHLSQAVLFMANRMAENA